MFTYKIQPNYDMDQLSWIGPHTHTSLPNQSKQSVHIQVRLFSRIRSWVAFIVVCLYLDVGIQKLGSVSF